MEVEVIFLPPIATELPRKLCIVVDVLRATSTLVTMFESGVRKITLAGSLQAALDLAGSTTPRPLVCGEVGGLPPAGFDLGNSPREYPPGSLDGRDLVFFTSNGTKAMRQLGQSPVVMTGAILNGTAAVRAALQEARSHGLDVSIVCSGDYMGTRFAIDDSFCAGYLCTILERATSGSGEELKLDESALAAMRLYQSYLAEAEEGDKNCHPRGQPSRQAILSAFWESHNAQVLDQVGLSEDVEYCAQVDISGKVPVLSWEGETPVLYPERG